MNLVAIDPSLSCTAMVVNGDLFIFANKNIALTKTGNYTKWFDLVKEYVNYTIIEYESFDDYSENEVNKLDAYDKVTYKIYDALLLSIRKEEEISISIEGYSFQSAPTSIIDLVTFSTLLRNKLHNLTMYLEILSPMSLKLEAAKLTYPAIQKGKKVIKTEYRNFEGVAGGSFTKKHMYQAIIDNQTFPLPNWRNFLITHKDDILSSANVPKPIEDLNDAILLWCAMSNNK